MRPHDVAVAGVLDERGRVAEVATAHVALRTPTAKEEWLAVVIE